ncbi:MAG: DUF2095 family protein [Candidatus Bathyarchaeota archaeon]|nr:DUF2095 family protein [Candidatus Bathyarchaeota archaeon]
MEKKDFKRLFPHIADEMDSGTSKVDLKKATEPPSSTEPGYKEDRKYAGFLPGAVDFIRRCKKVGEAEEIIGFLEKKGDIKKDEADALRKQLREEGLKSFGPHKGPGFYDK